MYKELAFVKTQMLLVKLDDATAHDMKKRLSTIKDNMQAVKMSHAPKTGSLFVRLMLGNKWLFSRRSDIVKCSFDAKQVVSMFDCIEKARNSFVKQVTTNTACFPTAPLNERTRACSVMTTC